MEQLVPETLDGLYRRGYHFTPNRAHRDVIQELFVDLWQRKANLGDTDSPRKYLCVSFETIWLYQKFLRKMQRPPVRMKSFIDMSWDFKDASQ